MDTLIETLSQVTLTKRIGFVLKKQGLLIESCGPANAGIGEVCDIVFANQQRREKAQIVGLNNKNLLLLPYGDVDGLVVGSEVHPTGCCFNARLGDGLLGRVINAFCQPIDNKGRIDCHTARPVKNKALPPLERRRINELLETGIRVIDSMLPIGYGQRLSIMAGSGVGKSTLLGMLVRNSVADVIVVGLIGERGREVLEFIEQTLGTEGLAKAIVVVATADEPALVRETAILTAITIAEYYRDQGKSVLLIVDSLTRYAMARREIGLSVGEPATSRGYTPSVFSEMAGLLERCGTCRAGGSITGLFTVLVEGDDIHDPIADSVRGVVDGHIVLTRELANNGHFPAVDVMASISRLANDLVTAEDQQLMKLLRQSLATLATNRDLVELGVYKEGSNPHLDKLLMIKPRIDHFLAQRINERTERTQAMGLLKELLRPILS